MSSKRNSKSTLLCSWQNCFGSTTNLLFYSLIWISYPIPVQIDLNDIDCIIDDASRKLCQWELYLLLSWLLLCGVGDRVGEVSRLPLKGETGALHTSCRRCKGEGARDDGSFFTALLEEEAGDPGEGKGWNRELMAETERELEGSGSSGEGVRSWKSSSIGMYGASISRSRSSMP